MKNCPQSKNKTVYEHCHSVYKYFSELKSKNISNWKIPSWLTDNFDYILSNLWDDEIIKDYILYHDCGKPFCHIIDDEGKSHFPDHANVSKRIYLENEGNEISAKLIGWDMILHTASSDEIENYCKKEWSIKDAFTLLLVSLSEVHANASMFGTEGIESTSFKIKWKKIDQRGKQILKYYKGK